MDLVPDITSTSSNLSLTPHFTTVSLSFLKCLAQLLFHPYNKCTDTFFFVFLWLYQFIFFIIFPIAVKDKKEEAEYCCGLIKETWCIWKNTFSKVSFTWETVDSLISIYAVAQFIQIFHLKAAVISSPSLSLRQNI